MADTHNFKERLAFSEGIQPGGAVLDAVMQMVPGSLMVERSEVRDDRNGTDFWITRGHSLPPLSIDMKNRGFCPIERFGSDDACIETTSIYRGDGPPWAEDCRRKVGWTIDYRKRTDFIVYTWPAAGGTRYWIVPFVPLCAAARKYWRDWAVTYRERPAMNEAYLTLSVYPPRAVIAQSMQKFMKGVAP